MYVLIPPSEGKSNDAGTGNFAELEPELIPNARQIFRHVDALKIADRARFYGTGNPAKTKQVHAVNRAALDGGCIPALERYTGVVYRSLEYPTLARPQDARRRLYIVSGYMGLVPGGAMLPLYKMPINPWLTRFWLPVNTRRTEELVRRKPVLSLLPQAYARAVGAERLTAVDFRIAGGRKPAGHAGKAIKGTFVRWIIENRVDSIKDIGDFTEDGYVFDGVDFIQK